MSSEALLSACCSRDVLSLTHVLHAWFRRPNNSILWHQMWDLISDHHDPVPLLFWVCTCVAVWLQEVEESCYRASDRRPIRPGEGVVLWADLHQTLYRSVSIVSWRSRVQHLASWTNDFCYNALVCPWISCVYFFPFRLTDHRWQHCIYASLWLVALFSLLSC